MSDYGFKISQEGFDVKTCDPKDLVMSSSFNLLKTYATGEADVGNFIFISLAYLPIFFAIGRITKGANPHYGFVGDSNSYLDANDYTLYVMDFDIRYYIFYHQF